MNKCSLCGREISSSENSFGLICLNKMRLVVNMKKVSNLKKERELDLKIQMLNWKWFLNNKELNEYIGDNVFKSFIGSILNNSGIAATAFNVINTYNIDLEFDYEVEV